MSKRMIIMLGAIALFIVAVGSFKFLQIKAAIAQGASWQPPPEAVTTIVTSQDKWPATLSVIGTVAAVQGVTVSADLPGIVESISFDSGKRVEAGDVLVKLDTRQERAQLAVAESQRDLSKLNFDRAQQLLQKGVVAQAEYDRMAAETKQAESRVGEIRAMIDRKQIRAPFSGTLGIRQINLGQYLEGGSAVVPLQSMDPVYVNFDVPQQVVASLKLGDEVRVSQDSIAAVVPAGRVTAINSVVDEATRNVQIQAVFRNPRAALRPGMFVEVEARLGTSAPVVALPASAVSYAPYGNSVYVVKDLKGKDGKSYRGVEQRFVKLGSGRGDQVAVVSGLHAGEEVVTSGVFKLRNGASVLINNKIRPSNSSTPKPEDS
ncbi:MAG TPA: efflux RND transporter periplasmic adaptor subunit [Candidatus Dormibacteraeota bacterium]|nr:efflux RND transporter periplasmic adaptor subunit [Candidatus Dormibacteraeota bacterium]